MIAVRSLGRFGWYLLGLALALTGCATAPETDADASSDGGGAGGGSAVTSSTSSAATTSAASTGGGEATVCGAAPCGGDLLGDWHYSTPCEETPWTEDACVDGLVRRSRYVLWPEGDVSFGADGTVTITKQLFAGWEFEIPLPCAPLGATCANAVQGDGVTCTQEGDLCLCTTVEGGPIESATEPYAVDGHEVTVGAADEAATLEFCVVGSQARFTHPETAETFYLSR